MDARDTYFYLTDIKGFRIITVTFYIVPTSLYRRHFLGIRHGTYFEARGCRNWMVFNF